MQLAKSIAQQGLQEIWYMLNPPTGSAHILSIPNATAGGVTSVCIWSFKAQPGYTSALDVTDSANGNSNTCSKAVVTTVDGAVIIDAAECGSSRTFSANNQTLIQKWTTGSPHSGAQYALQATAGSITFSWTLNNSTTWAIAVAAFKEVILANPPTVATGAATAATDTTATVPGNVTSDGGAPVTERGICYNTTGTPTTADNKVTAGTGTGAFSANLTGLTAATTYYCRAYVINTSGSTSYGSEIQVQTLVPLTRGYVYENTYTSFKMQIDQGSMIGTIEDRFYIDTSPMYTEPTRTPDVTLTTIGNDHVSFTGLNPGTLYYVRGYRRFYGVSYLVYSTVWLDGFTTVNNIITNPTADAVIDHNGPWGKFWLQSNGPWFGLVGEPPSMTSYSCMDNVPDPTQELGGDYKFVVQYGVAITRVRFHPGHDATISFKFKYNQGVMDSPGTNDIDWLGFSLYAAESQYMGVYWLLSGATAKTDPTETVPSEILNCAYQATPPIPGNPYLSRGVHQLVIAYNGADGTATYTLDGTDTWNVNFAGDEFFGGVPPMPMALWFMKGPFSGLSVPSNHPLEIGPITVSGAEIVYGATDYEEASMWAADQMQVAMVGSREALASPQTHISQCGGCTVRYADGTDWKDPATMTAYPLSVQTIILDSSVDKPASGYKYDKFEVIARQGTLSNQVKVQFYDKLGSLISDAQIPGNSTGFYPTSDTVYSIDLSGVLYAGVSAKVSITNGDAAADQFAGPLFKSGTFRFVTGSVIDVSIDPVTSPTPLNYQTITGKCFPGDTIVVTVDTSATVGTVTYPTSDTWSCDITDLPNGTTQITASNGSSADFAFINYVGSTVSSRSRLACDVGRASRSSYILGGA